MKKILALALLILSFGCKNTSEKLTTLKGSYMFFEDAAVLQTPNEIYGVYLNDKALALNDSSKRFKTTQTDEVIVEVKGVISTEKHEKILWEKKFEIIEIISISSKKETNNTLILGTE